MRKLLGPLLGVVLITAGCGGGEPAAPATATADRAVDTIGAELFEERVIGAAPGCVTCHSTDDGVTLVGPSLFGLVDRAAFQVPGLTAAEYVRQSITEPDAFIVPGFTAGQMAGDWVEILSEEQIDSLVELLLSG